MGKALGIAGFVLLIVSLPIPFVGNYLSLLALGFAVAAALQGERTWALVTDLLAWPKMLLMSPTWGTMMWGDRGSFIRENRGFLRGSGMDGFLDQAQGVGFAGNPLLVVLTFGLLIAPLVILYRRRQTKQAPQEGL